MKVCVPIPYTPDPRTSADTAAELERAGADLLWVPEAYGFDAPTLIGYLAAKTTDVEIGSGILPIYTRSPAVLAMTAAGADALSLGRFHLGLGASGPQVIEGFHGVRYQRPLQRTREVVAICRQVWARRAPLEFKGTVFEIPLREGSGLGKPLKLISPPVRSSIPVWIAALGEKNVAMAAEIADGWLPTMFIPERAADVWGESLRHGAMQRDPELGPLWIAAGGPMAIGEGTAPIEMRQRARAHLALYIGGMGAKGKNFYNDLVTRYGFGSAADEIQSHFLAGRKKEAEAAVPEELLEQTSLCGPASYVAERVAAYREAGVTHLQVLPLPSGDQTVADVIRTLRELLS
jgi:F420-dependent oxidoreductase-like protein